MKNLLYVVFIIGWFANVAVSQQITKIELVGGKHKYSGRVEIVYNGTKGTICDDSFDYKDAAVVCRMLGFRDVSPVVLTDVNGGTGQIWLDDMECLGHESSIKFCKHSGWGKENCDHTEDVGVSCVPENELITKIELVGGLNICYGRVEIVFDGRRGTVCGDHFDRRDAAVVCRMLGFSHVSPVALTAYGGGDGRIWLDDMKCFGHELLLDSCKHSGWGRENCSHAKDVGVSCFSESNIHTSITPSSGTPSTTCTFEGENVCNFIQDNTDNFNWTKNSGSTSSSNTGPSFDHTYENSLGHYMYIEATSRNQGDKARLLLPVHPHVTTNQFLQFYYHMYGSEMGTLNVKLRLFDTTENVIWTKSGNQNDQWHIAQVPLEESKIAQSYQIVFEGIRGIDYGSDIAIDDVSITTMNCQKTAWTVRLTNGHHANAGRVHVEIGQISGFICDEDFDDFDASVICNMLGFSFGSADQESSSGISSGRILLDGIKCNGTEPSIQLCEHRGLFNTRDVCDLRKAAGVTCHSSRETGITPSSGTDSINCTFESKNTCPCIQDDTDDLNWMRTSGSTKSYNTGPSYDHTYRNSSGHYIYIEASSRKLGEKARLLLPVYLQDTCTTDHHLQFSYHMYGSNMGTLNVKLRISNTTENVIWTITGDQHERWHIAHVPLEVSKTGNSYQIVFEGIRGNDFKSDIAIDDVSITSMKCQKTGRTSTADRKEMSQGRTSTADRKEMSQGTTSTADRLEMSQDVKGEINMFKYIAIGLGVTTGLFFITTVAGIIKLVTLHSRNTGTIKKQHKSDERREAVQLNDGSSAYCITGINKAKESICQVLDQEEYEAVLCEQDQDIYDICN